MEQSFINAPIIKRSTFIKKSANTNQYKNYKIEVLDKFRASNKKQTDFLFSNFWLNIVILKKANKNHKKMKEKLTIISFVFFVCLPEIISQLKLFINNFQEVIMPYLI